MYATDKQTPAIYSKRTFVTLEDCEEAISKIKKEVKRNGGGFNSIDMEGSDPNIDLNFDHIVLIAPVPVILKDMKAEVPEKE